LPQKKGPRSFQSARGKENVVVTNTKTAAAVQTQGDGEQGKIFGLTSHQIKQLLKLILQSRKIQQAFSDTDDELEHSFAGNVFCSCSAISTSDWIVDTGTTDHITPHAEDIKHVIANKTSGHINMPNGAKAEITHQRSIELQTGLKLDHTLYVPSFKFKLMSVSKFVQTMIVW